MTDPSLTIFTAPKPFVDTHIKRIQINAIRSWINLGANVQIVLLGDDEGVAQAARNLGVLHIPGVDVNEKGTPILSSIFSLARDVNCSPSLMYINADIIILSGLMKSIHLVASSFKKYLMVGQRYDIDINTLMSFTNNWIAELEGLNDRIGHLHPRAGSDYFVFPRDCFKEIPKFAVGRAGWDNWMIYFARLKKWPVVDATKEVTILHQNHDYSHLPGGQIHYHLPESNLNLELAGGKRAIFTLEDTNYMIKDQKIKKIPVTWNRFKRGFEVFPLIFLKSRFLGNLFFLLCHPKKGMAEIRLWIKRSSKKSKDAI